MPLHFATEEYAARRAKAIAAMEAAGLDGMLMFRQESMYYLTGYDTFGYVFFQCLYLGVDGHMMLLTRAPDLRQAQQTSVIQDIRIWVDRDGANPALELKDALVDFDVAGKKIGVEWEAYGLTARNGQRLSAALEGWCTLTDASDLISRLRIIKSSAELVYVRRAAKLADDALTAAEKLTHAGTFEGDILAAMHGAIYKGGGDDPANEFIIGSGPQALLCRYQSARRHLSEDDQLTLEWAGVYHHYHAAMMRTLLVGRVPDRQREMHEATVAAMEACVEAVKPGNPMGQVFDAYAGVLDKRGFREGRLNACGYGMGTTFAPNWMDWPMFYTGNPVIMQPGMVFFLHMILYDDVHGLAMAPGQSVLVTADGCEVLSRKPLDLFVR
ncbi:M24 family metallopeptidase [Radicibacter daui]|uniref:M24 family metallopeptidase n=1 Tax=Radicibacter daui TaxID=3064829 RepID=UPI004046C11E